MPSISEIVSVSISLQTSAVTQTGFGTLLVIGESEKLPSADVWTITNDATLITANSFTCKVNGDVIGPVVFATDNDTTMAAIATAIQAHADVITAAASDVGTVGYDNTITVTSEEDTEIVITEAAVTLGATQPTTTTVEVTDLVRVREYANITAVAVDFAITDPEYRAANAAFSQDPGPTAVKIGRKMVVEAWVDALDACILEDPDFYGVCMADRTKADVLLIAAAVESRGRIFSSASNDGGMLTTGTTDIAGTFASNSYDRSAAMYHQDADGSVTDDWIDAAWMGDMLSTKPGSATWMFRTLAGVTVTTGLTDTQSDNVLDKKGNLYQTIHGANMTRNGTAGSGEFLDTIRGADWLEARIAERVFAVMRNQPKVPFTDGGIASVVAEAKAQLEVAVGVGYLASSPAPAVTFPQASSVSINDKANRLLPDIDFAGTLAGAIHKTAIAGVISV